LARRGERGVRKRLYVFLEYAVVELRSRQILPLLALFELVKDIRHSGHTQKHRECQDLQAQNLPGSCDCCCLKDLIPGRSCFSAGITWMMQRGEQYATPPDMNISSLTFLESAPSPKMLA